MKCDPHVCCSHCRKCSMVYFIYSSTHVYIDCFHYQRLQLSAKLYQVLYTLTYDTLGIMPPMSPMMAMIVSVGAMSPKAFS